MAYLFMGGEDCETGASRLVLIGSAKRPKGNWATAELGEPALQLGLGGVMRKSAHVEYFAALRQERSNVSSGVHWFSEYVWMILRGLGFADETSEYACERNSLFHSTPWRRWG